MKHLKLYRIILYLCIVFTTQVSLSAPLKVAPEYEDRYHALLNELRCLVCQNQTIAESDSELANDLRVEVNKMLNQGASDDEIIDFMANRYGDFVLYKPLVQPKTYLLWFGPFLFLALVLLLVLMFLKKNRPVSKAELTDDEKQKLSSILKEPKD
ncbi:MAG: cytochrome c-type biogenesis protein [Pseudomonadota bacterium]